MYLYYYNDGKEKYQSHEISIKSDEFNNFELNLFSHDFFDITGYGATKEEALEDFKKKFDYVMKEWEVFRDILHSDKIGGLFKDESAL